MTNYILTLSCTDDFGIVSAVAQSLSEQGAFILQSDQFSDTETRKFFFYESSFSSRKRFKF